MSSTVEQRGTDFAERWRVEEQHRLARADAEADRELARLPASEEADEVEARLRREVARGKRRRVEAASNPALRARTGPPLPPLTGLLEAREQGRGEKRSRALGLDRLHHDSDAARADSIRRKNVDGESRRRSGV